MDRGAARADAVTRPRGVPRRVAATARWVLLVGAVAAASGLVLRGQPGVAGSGGWRLAAWSGWRLLAPRTPQGLPEQQLAPGRPPDPVAGPLAEPRPDGLPPPATSAPGPTGPLASVPLSAGRMASVTQSSVRRLHIDGPWGPLALEQSPGPDVPPERRWRMVQPCCAPADAPLVEGALASLLTMPVHGPLGAGLRPDELERYGLLDPELRIELHLEPPSGAAGATASRTVVLSVGAPAGWASAEPPQPVGEWRYVKLAGSPEVYAAPAEALEPLRTAMPGLWRRRQVVGLARHELKRLAIRMAGRPGPVTLQQEGSRWRLGPTGAEAWGAVPTTAAPDGAEAFVEALWALQGHLVEPQAPALEALRRQGAFSEPALEVVIAGFGDRPPTRLVAEAEPLAAGEAGPPVLPRGSPVLPSLDPTQEGWGGQVEPWFTAGATPLRRVYVEQGEERLLYAVSSVALRELEAAAAPWTAPPPGEPYR